MDNVTKEQYLTERKILDDKIKLKQEELSDLCARRDVLDKFFFYYGSGDKSSINKKEMSTGPRDAVRQFARECNEWFSNGDLAKFLRIKFPGLSLNTNRRSTILHSLVKRDELDVMLGPNNRVGNQYRWANKKDHQTTFVEVG